MGIPSLTKKRLRLHGEIVALRVDYCGNPFADEEAIGRSLETGDLVPGASPRGNPLVDHARARLACWVLLAVSLAWRLKPDTWHLGF